MVRVAAIVLLMGLACSAAPAPAVEPVAEQCFEDFCLAVPSGWSRVTADGEIRYAHAGGASASISTIDAGFLVDSSGIDAAVDLAGVEEAYWALLDAAGGRVEATTATQERAFSVGETDTGRRWHGLIHAGPPPAMVAITVSVPDSSWDEHGRTWVEGLRLP